MYFDFRPLFRRTFAELSRKYPYSQTPAISRGRIEGKANTRGLGNCPKAPPHRELNQNQTEILWCPSPARPRAAVGGSALHNDCDIPLSQNFREKKCYFRKLGKNTFARACNTTCTAFAIKTPYKDL